MLKEVIEILTFYKCVELGIVVGAIEKFKFGEMLSLERPETA